MMANRFDFDFILSSLHIHSVFVEGGFKVVRNIKKIMSFMWINVLLFGHKKGG
jgi:hypothetical protein